MSQIDDFLNGAQQPSDIDSFLGPDTPKPAGAIRKLGDLGLSVAKGVIAVPEAAVGLADLVSGGRAGKLAEDAGVRFKDAKDVLSGWQSDDLKGKQQEFQDADGILSKAGVALSNPSLVANTVAESVPLMGVGGVGARALLAAAPKIGAVGAGALGEGIAGAGSAGEQTRQETADGLLTGKQAALSATSGLATAAFGAAGGKLAKRFGVGDVDTMLAGGTTNVVAGAVPKGAIRRGAEGAVSEGLLEELPQSLSEQALQNAALDKPLTQGLEDAAVLGTLAGGVMGAGAGAISNPTAKQPAPVVPPVTPPATPALQIGNTPDPLLSFKDGTVARRSEIDAYINGLPEDQKPAARAKMMGLAPQPADAADLAAPVAPTVKPSEAMGLNPAAGPMSAAAAIAVDTGVFDANAQADSYRAETEILRKQQEDQAKADLHQAFLNEATAPVDLSADDLFPLPKSEPVEGSFAAKLKAAVAKKDADGQPDAAPDTAGDSAPTGRPDVPTGVGTGLDADAGSDAQPGGATPAVLGEPAQLSGGVDAGAVTKDANVQDAQAGTQAAPVEATGKAPQVVASPATGADNVPAAARAAVEGAGVAGIDDAAHAASTSPLNALPQPTDAQKKAGNYAKGHVTLNGLDLSIENPAGSERSGTDKDGKTWTNTLQHHYGYIKGTLGNDKDHVDAFVKPGTPADHDGPVYVVDQNHPDTGKFDEHKVLIGFDGLEEAKAAYKANYAKGWSGLKAISTMPFAEFKTWVKDGVKNKPLVAITQSVPTAAPASSIKTVTAKQIPDMSDAELQQAISHYGPQHARTAKITKEVNRRALVAKLKAKDSQPQGSTNEPAPTLALEAEKEGSQTPESRPADAAAGVDSSLRRISRDSPVVGREGESNPTVVDAQGKEYRVFSQRHDLVVAHPIVDGKPVVSRDTAVRFWTNPDTPPAGDSDRIDPIYQKKDHADQTEQQQAPAAVTPPKPSLKARIAQERQARADYFTPGNIVTSYGGHDEVLSYTPPNEKGGDWSVKVRAVVKMDGQWVPDPKDNRERSHATQPDARELVKGPVDKAKQADAAAEAPKTHTVESVAKAIQIKVAQNRRKYRESDRAKRAAKNWAANSTPESEQADYDEEISNEPSDILKKSAANLISSDPAALIEMFVNGRYEASEDVFREITGVKIRGLSAKDKKAALYKWANWTPEQIAQAENAVQARQDEKAEKYKQDDLKDAVRGAWTALERLKVKESDGTESTGQDFILKAIASGFDKAHSQKKGVALIYGLTNGKNFTTLKGGALTKFVKAAINFGGLDKAMEYVNPPKLKAPDGFVDRSVDTKDSTPASENIVGRKDSAQLAQPDDVVERTPIEHAGVKIYPVTFKGEPRWAAQTDANKTSGKVFGDTIHATLDEAKQEAERQVARIQLQQERNAAHEAEQAAAQAKKDANKGKSIVERRRDALLDKPTNLPIQAGLGNGTKRESMQKAVDQERAIVEKMVDDPAAKKRDNDAVDLVRAKGYILGLSNENLPVVKAGLEAQARVKANDYKKPSYRVYSGRDTDGSFYEISKTEYDYAQELKAKPARETITPANDKHLGANADGEPVYERKDGSIYKLDSRNGGKPNFGSDLAVVQSSTAEPAAQASDNILSIQMGGSTQTLDLGKPAWLATDAELVQAVDDSGAYLGKPGSKYDPYMAWREAHGKAIEQAVKDGKQFPNEILYDKPGLIRSDLTPDEADIAVDKMVDVYRATKDYGKAVQAYRDFGKPAAQNSAPAAQATAILDAANITGKERIDVLKDIKKGDITPEELQAAYPAKEESKPSKFTSDGVGRSEAENELQALSHKDERPGDVQMSDGSFAPFDSVVTLAREGIASGDIRPVPAQLHFKLDMAMRDVDRVLKATQEGKPAKIEDSAQPAAKEEAKPTTSIGDFGEKIGGAKKDLWATYQHQLADVNDADIATQPLSKSWPQPDYQALLDGGADPWTVGFVRAARDAIPRKPNDARKAKAWAGQVQVLREFAVKLLNGDVTRNHIRVQIARLGEISRSMEGMFDRIQLYMLVGHSQSLEGVKVTRGEYGMHNGITYSPAKIIWTVNKEAKATAFSNWPRELGTGATKEEAIADFQAKYATTVIQPVASKEATFDIWSESGAGSVRGYFVGKKIGRNYVKLTKAFPTVKEARDYKTNNHAELIAALEKAKEIPSVRRDTNMPRVGEDMRAGQDVTPPFFGETFGFKGVEFGNYVEQSKRQKDLNNAFDALMDMAAILGLPPKALSLNGQLGLAFGARGTGGIDPAAAHYERDYVAINLTKKEGAGSLGHEWWHAVDNYFSRMRKSGDAMMTEGLDVSLASKGSSYYHKGEVRKEMVDAFGAVMKAIRSTAIKARSSRLDAKRSKEYWTTSPEMSARAFESYLISKLRDNNASNDYLANIVDEKTWKAMESLGMELDDSYPYPNAGEIPAIRSGFEHFFDTVQTKETEQGIAMFSQGLLSPPSFGPKPTLEHTQRLVDKVLQVAKNVIPVSVIGNPGQIAGIQVPVGAKPKGALIDGRIYLFADNIESIGDAYVTLFHELFHLGLQKVIPAEDYATMLRQFSRNVLVQKYLREWKASPEGVEKAAKMPSAAYEALATEEAMAMISEELHANASMGTRKLPGLVKTMLSWFAGAADRLGFPAHIGNWMRQLTQSDAEKFVTDMVRASMGGDKNLGRTRAKYGTELAEMTAQTRLSAGGVKFSSRDIKDGMTSNSAAPQVKPLTEKQFYSQYAQHIDFRGRRNGTAQANKESILRDGFKKHINVNAVPPYRGGAPTDWSGLKFGPRKGDVVYLAPKGAWKDAPNGMEIQDGWAPKPYEVIEVSEDYPSMYQEYLKAFNASTAPTSGGAQTDTAAFKKWFGDSKVVDDQGKPLVVYHGSKTAGITEFNTSAENNNGERGTFFSAKKSATEDYGSSVYEAHLSIKNPYEVTAKQWAMGEGMTPVEANEAGHDGYIIRGLDGKNGDAFIAFNPSQIKSAIGNNGDFDTSNPDIRFSMGARLNAAANNVRDVKLPAGYVVGDLINSAPGKLNWWHKTIGTQYNLAQRSAPFKRVFDGVQNFLNDVSYFATEAADLAPNILPKLETWKDIGKAPLSAADTKAISAPIFEGTLIWARDESGQAVKMDVLEAQATQLSVDQKAQRLLRGNHITEQVLRMWRGMKVDQYEAAIAGKYERDMLKAGLVFTPAELKSLFNLTPAQIGLYKEFRAATDKSLTNLAIADMLRFGGEDVAPVRELVLESKTVNQAADTLAEYLRSLADADAERGDVLRDTADKIIGKGDKAHDLTQRGYAPLSRFGQYTLDVMHNGERVYFGLFESKMDAAKMNRQMAGQFPGAQITQGTVSEQAYKMFAGVSPETLELFGDMLGLEAQGDDASAQAFQEYLKLAKSSRSAMKRLLHRKGIAGFNEDAGRVLAGFVYSNARQTSSSLHMGEMTQAAADKDAFRNQGELQDAAVKLVDYIKNPQEEAQAFRGLLFAQYIGGSVASAMVNMTQPMTMTFPWLSQFGGVTSAAKQMAAAVKDVGKKQTGDAQLDAALHRAEEDGTVSPQEVHQLMQQSMGKGALRSGDGTRSGDALATGQNMLSRFNLGWGKLFSAAEQFNRRVTFIAAYRTAVAQGMADPDGFARKAISETQGIYNKANKPQWARGALGGVLFTFKQYSIAYVEMLSRMAKNGPEGRKAALLALAVLFLTAGAGGMPGADDLDDLISGLLQSMGYNFDSKAKRQAFFAELVGEGGAQFLERGVSGLPGVPIDVSGRMGLGNLIPGTGLFTKKQDHTRDVAELLGPGGDLVKRGFDAAGKAIKGEIGGHGGAALTLAPKAMQNWGQAFDMANRGMYRDAKGMKVLETDGYDALSKAIGFQPNEVKRSQDASFEVQRMIGLNKIRESELANRWALGIFEKDADKVKAARDDLAQWNRDNPESPIRINFKQVAARVQNMNQTKAERIAKTAPRELRAAVRQELAASK